MISIDMTFDLPVGAVAAFDVLADPRRDPDWQKSCAEVVLDDPTSSPAAGLTYSYVLQMMGRRLEFRNRLTDYVRSERVAYEVVTGPVGFVGAYAIVGGANDDTCTVRWTFDVDKGTGFALMPDSLLRKAITKQAEKDQATLRRLLIDRNGTGADMTEGTG